MVAADDMYMYIMYIMLQKNKHTWSNVVKYNA